MKTNDQFEFSFNRKVEKNEVDPRPMISFLEHCEDWTLAADIPYFNPRQLRAMAEASDGQIISGPRGYKLTRKASIEEINACMDRLTSQADAMTSRALKIRTVYHSRNF